MSVVKSLNQLDKEKVDLIYDLDPDEFTELINSLFIKQFDLFLTEKDLKTLKNINDSVKSREEKVKRLDLLLADILKNMPDHLINKTYQSRKVNLDKFNQYRINKLSELLNKNYRQLEAREIVFNLSICLFDLMNDLNTIQHLIILFLEFFSDHEDYINKLALSFGNIDFYIGFFEDPENEKLIKSVLKDFTFEEIKLLIKQHKHFLETFPVYKELYEKNKMNGVVNL